MHTLAPPLIFALVFIHMSCADSRETDLRSTPINAVNLQAEDQTPKNFDAADAQALLTESELPKCGDKTKLKYFYIISRDAFKYCIDQKWEDIDPSDKGEAGKKEFKSLVDIKDLESGQSRCTHRGLLVRTGLDLNRNKKIEGNEVYQKRTVCTGDRSLELPKQKDVPKGRNALVKQTVEAKGPHCRTSGYKVEVGLDEDNDHALSASEVSHTRYLCDNVQKIYPAAPSFEVSSFEAKYYRDDTLVMTETVPRPAINYSYADFQNISSYNFHAVWTGTLTAKDIDQMVDINFDVGWSEVKLTIDGQVVADWRNHGRTVQYLFAPGEHKIEIEYFNHWHTTSVNVSFTGHRKYSASDAAPLLKNLTPQGVKILYVGSYESDHKFNEVTVALDSQTGPVFLFVSSYHAVNWIIHNPANVEINGIAYHSYESGSTISTGKTVPTFELASGLSYAYSDFSEPAADIKKLIGREPDEMQGGYAILNVAF